MGNVFKQDHRHWWSNIFCLLTSKKHFFAVVWSLRWNCCWYLCQDCFLKDVLNLNGNTVSLKSWENMNTYITFLITVNIYMMQHVYMLPSICWVAIFCCVYISCAGCEKNTLGDDIFISSNYSLGSAFYIFQSRIRASVKQLVNISNCLWITWLSRWRVPALEEWWLACFADHPDQSVQYWFHQW